MKYRFVVGISLLALLQTLQVYAGQYDSIDYHIQQMITLSAAQNTEGVTRFREMLDNLERPKTGDAVKAKPFRQQGVTQLDRGDLQKALIAFRQAFIADPADADIAGYLGLTYLRLQRLQEAERLLVYGLSLDSDRETTWLTLGQVYAHSGDLERATGAFANAYRFAPNPPQIVQQLRDLGAAADIPHDVRIAAQQAVQLTQAGTSSTQSTVVALPPPAPSTETVYSPPKPSPNTPLQNNSAITRKTVPGSMMRNLTGFIRQWKQRDTATSSHQEPDYITANSVTSGQQIYKRSLPLTCLVVTFKNGKKTGFGSGLLISTEGLVLTNNHVVEKAGKLVVRCGGQESAAKIRQRHTKPDLALLSTTIKAKESFVLNQSYSQNLIGSEVFVIGHPYGLEGTFSTGIISGLREIDGVRYIQISAPISQGNSGGPVILYDGTVIGIATMLLKVGQNLNFAIASAEVISSDLFDPSRMRSK